MAKYEANEAAVTYVRKLIDARQYVLDSDWGDGAARVPRRRTPTWSGTPGRSTRLAPRPDRGRDDETKARYAFVYGDFRRVHRSGLIACVYRASEWRHKDVELAAHELLQQLDEVAGIAGTSGR